MTFNMCRAAGMTSGVAWLALSACTPAQLQSRSASYAIIDTLSASSGAHPSDFAGSLGSDVVTMVKHTVDGQIVSQPTMVEDMGRVSMHLALADPGTVAQPATPSAANTVTFTRYHVAYLRADGRNVAGLDVPFGFDGGLTFSVTGTTSVATTFVLVRAQAKQEPPLRLLQGGGGAQTISTITQVTFYGGDQAGRAVAVTGTINIHFSDWADPD